MKRLIVGSLLWLAVVAVLTVIGLRWPVVFWLLTLSVCLYLIFGRRAAIEFRFGVGTRRSQKRLYAAIVWQRPAKEASGPEVERVECEDLNVEEPI